MKILYNLAVDLVTVSSELSFMFSYSTFADMFVLSIKSCFVVLKFFPSHLRRQEREQAKLHTCVQQRNVAAHRCSVASHGVRAVGCGGRGCSQGGEIWIGVLGDYREVHMPTVR